MCPFKGRFIYKQYIPSKRTRYGIKSFKLCTKSGYTLKIVLYFGSETWGNLSVDEKEVQDKTFEISKIMMENFLNKGKTLYCDKYFLQYH